MQRNSIRPWWQRWKPSLRRPARRSPLNSFSLSLPFFSFPFSSDDAVHLEHLGVLAVHVDPMGTRDVPDVLGVRVAAMLLRRVLLQRGDLALEVARLE